MPPTMPVRSLMKNCRCIARRVDELSSGSYLSSGMGRRPTGTKHTSGIFCGGLIVRLLSTHLEDGTQRRGGGRADPHPCQHGLGGQHASYVAAQALDRVPQLVAWGGGLGEGS